MATGISGTSFRERSESRSKLYWLDIDVTFDDITRQQQIIPSRLIVRRPPSVLQYSVLHGVATVANALSVGDAATSFDRFQVDVAALVRTEDDLGLRLPVTRGAQQISLSHAKKHRPPNALVVCGHFRRADGRRHGVSYNQSA